MHGKQGLFLFLILTFVFQPLFSQTADKAQNTARMMERRPIPRKNMKMGRHEGNFSVIGIKIEESEELIVFSLYFNESIDTNSILGKNILINDRPLPQETEFLFNKVRRMLQFSMEKSALNAGEKAPLDLKIIYAKSFFGKILKASEIKNLETNSFFKYSRGTGTWQKS